MKVNGINNIQNIKQTEIAKNNTNKNINSKQKQINELSNIYYKPLSFGRTCKRR